MKTSKMLMVFTLMTVLSSNGMAQEVASPNPYSQNTVQDPKTKALGNTIYEFTLSQKTGKPPEGMGFYSPDSKEIPEVIAKAKNSVFRLIAFQGNKNDFKEMFGDISIEEAISKVKAAPEEKISELERSLLIFQLTKCLRLRMDPCQLEEDVSEGTAFVTGDGKEVRTSLHVVEEQVKEANKKSDKSIDFLLLNDKNKIVYDPSKQKAKLVAVPNAAYEAGADSDQVLIKLEKPIAPGLKVSPQPASPGEQAYMVGSPHKTEGRNNYNAQDSDGESILISKGTILGPETLMKRAEQAGIYVNQTYTKEILSNRIALTADGAPRMSGAAILNSKGEVIGVYGAGMPQSGAVNPFRISYGSKNLLQESN